MCLTTKRKCVILSATRVKRVCTREAKAELKATVSGCEWEVQPKCVALLFYDLKKKKKVGQKQSRRGDYTTERREANATVPLYQKGVPKTRGETWRNVVKRV